VTLHSILRRQLTRLNVLERAPDVAEWDKVCAVVSEQYGRLEDDYKLLERSLELAMVEMTEVQDRLRKDARALQQVIAAIDGAVIGLRDLPTGPGPEHNRTRAAQLTSVSERFNETVQRSLSEITSVEHNTIITSVRDGFTRLVEQFHGLLLAASEDEQARREQEVTQIVQKMLLPTQALNRPTLHAAGVTLPASVCGGDWWSMSALRDNRCLLVMGDVTGHGLPSAMLTAVAKASYDVARAALKPLTLDGMLKLMNLGVIESARRQLFMTACAMSFDENTREVRYANAGHLPPLLVNRQGIQPLPLPGAALGMSPVLDVEQRTVQVEVGDLLVLYTDGITEARNRDGEEFGEKRLRALIGTMRDGLPEQVCDEIIAAVTRFCGGRGEDDQSVLVARVME
jgi:serine phosphatase RsbU (regulator of sigma subunit)